MRDLEAWGEIAFTPDDLMRRTFALVDGCDALLIDLKEKGVGVGLEAGYAHARGRPVIVLLPAGAELSTTLAGIARAVLTYTTYADLRVALAARLPELGLTPRPSD
ncbi:MAG: hypothetical protein IT318_01215 [Anaerolineales bacterium]|nr:hypothetical protein [Anaerolineales bacterium]